MPLDDVSIKARPWRVRDLVALQRERRLHLPDFQRGFVWEAERVRALFDSLLRRYPTGSLLLWKPGWAADDDEPVSVRPWDIFLPDTTLGLGQRPVPTNATPGDYFVLDGQQRLTSLFRVIFDNRRPGYADREPDLLVSLARKDRWAEAPFMYRTRQVTAREELDGLIIPAATLFAGVRTGDTNGAESKAVAEAVSKWLNPLSDAGAFFNALDRANELRNAILNAEIVAYELEMPADDDSVIEIFARLNQQGIRLTPADLAAARLSGELREMRPRAAAALADPAFDRFRHTESQRRNLGGFVDTDLIIRVATYLARRAVKYRDLEKSKEKKRAIYEAVAARWDDAVAALRTAVTLVRAFGADGATLPYRYLLLPIAVAIANHRIDPADQASVDPWLGWLLAASLWGHYSGSSETRVEVDAHRAAEGDMAGLLAHVRQTARRADTLLPDPEELTQGLVSRAGVVLYLRTKFRAADTRSFRGRRISEHLDALDLHHIFARDSFRSLGRAAREVRDTPDRIGNLTLLVATENSEIGGRLPSDYLPEVSALPGGDRILEDHLLPDDPTLWSFDAYDAFCQERERRLAIELGDALRRLGVA